MEKPVYYTNRIGIGVSNLDFSLVVARKLASSSPDKEDTEEVLCTILMSPQHAKIFTELLCKNVKQYEDLFGTIVVNPDEEKFKKMQDIQGK
ncbi:DUF3467 domain-containing protein [Anaeroselena agilis]|uniref:DUF3467 domain-containing protein n=1 Tax=Anaeroselena agilis TaxID=3063788 RepID=A0ABU3NYE2_9FIRM|nr:DUF3467 domain-containing protein [Selenomonadales bacterium 4137-cl]